MAFAKCLGTVSLVVNNRVMVSGDTAEMALSSDFLTFASLNVE